MLRALAPVAPRGAGGEIMPGMPDRRDASRRRRAAAFPVPGGARVPRVAHVTDPHAPPREDRG